MFGSMDLTQVLRQQEQLRREAAQRRLAATLDRKAKHDDRAARRVLGLRISFA
jgi:hypothetical protein